MPLLDWLDEDEEDTGSLVSVYLVPIYKKQWGTFSTQAVSEEAARLNFVYSTSDEVELNTEWDGDPQYEYESCGMIEIDD